MTALFGRRGGGAGGGARRGRPGWRDEIPTVFTDGACPADGRGQTFRFGLRDCGADGCVVQYYVPLRRGDALVVRGRALPWKTLAAFYAHDGDRPFDQADWGVRLGAPAWVGGDREARFDAPRDGWYLLWLAALEGGAELEPFGVCVRRERSGAR